jgi:hypothetical protein
MLYLLDISVCFRITVGFIAFVFGCVNLRGLHVFGATPEESNIANMLIRQTMDSAQCNILKTKKPIVTSMYRIN